MNAAAQSAWLTDAGVPSKVAADAVARREAPGDALQQLRAVSGAGDVFVALSGDVGVGKSTAAAAWLLDRLAAEMARWGGMDVAPPPCARWLHAHQLARLSGLQADGLDKLERVPWLVLDDLGVEYLDGKGWLGSAIDSLVYQRHGNARPTVLTTNLGVDEFGARYGERVRSRLRECCAFLRLAGVDLRRPPDAVR